MTCACFLGTTRNASQIVVQSDVAPRPGLTQVSAFTRSLKVYWEKTVEYCFLWRCSAFGLVDFASPMSGKQERGAGDAVFGSYSKLLLIEFKSDANSLDSEEDKFDDFKAAKRLLSKTNSHHLLVYGVTRKETVDIEATTYFSRDATEIASTLPAGLAKEPFDKYLAQFLAFRKRDGRSGAKATVPDFANVIGLNAKGQIVQACTLAEYTAEVFPSLVQELISEPEANLPSGPKFRA